MISIATKEDLPRVVELVKAGIEELHFNYPVQDNVLADSVYRSFMLAPCFLVRDGNDIVGVASLTLGNFPWSQKPYLTSNMVYVLPSNRSYSIVRRLYDYIINYAKLQGISYLDNFMGNDKIDGRLRLAQSKGLEQTGISIKYEVKT